MTVEDELRARIEVLEAQVRALTEREATSAVSRAAPGAAMTRRRVLRGAGLALAGAGGVLASPALTSRAAAADNDPVRVGMSNTGVSTTSLTSSATGPTLELEATGTGASLRLTDDRDAGPTTLDVGDVFQFETFFYNAFAPDGAGIVFDSSYATFLLPFTPTRVLETRSAAATEDHFGRTLVTNPAGKFDSAGRLRGGQTVNLRFDDFTTGAAGMAANFIAVNPLASGFMRVWNTGIPQPNASIVNFTKSQTIGNWAVVPVGVDQQGRDSISIFTNQTTHVVVDASGALLSDLFSINASPDKVTGTGRRHPTARRR